MSLSSAAGRLTAVLGPTNTGKTYLAIERMLGHEFGHDRLSAAPAGARELRSHRKVKGASQVALITGEENIAPPGARYFVCTVESMPLDRMSRSSPSTKCRWRPIPSAAISSPTGC